MSKHSIEERLSAVKRYLNGEASTFIEKQTGIDHHDIIVYAMRYRRDGLSGLEDRKQHWCSYDEKKAAITDYLKESLTVKRLHPYVLI